MKNILPFLLCAALATGCSTESNLRHDLIGHTTGGRESSWLFREGQIKQLKIVSENRIVNMILQSKETGESFFVTVQVNYRNGKIESVGLLFIQKI